MTDSEFLGAETSDAVDGRLATRLLSSPTFEYFIADCKVLVADEVKKKGMPLRTAFKVAQKVKPDLVDRTVRELVPEFIQALEPCYTDYLDQDTYDLRSYLIAHDAEVADVMLAVSDRRAEKIHSRTIQSTYDRVRGRAQREIVDAMPGIASTIAKHA